MQIKKVIANNMVSVYDDYGGEMLLKGPGIGFKKRPGDLVDEERIEKRFVLADRRQSRRFEEIAVEIDAEVIEVCIDVVTVVKEDSPRPLSDTLYVTFIDHVSNLIDRLEHGIVFDNSILWNIKRIYPDEYELAYRAVGMLNERLPYEIDEDEASFIALHIVNSELMNDMNRTYKVTKYIEDICDIVSSNLHVEFNEGDYRVNRFLIHLKFLFESIEKKTAISGDSSSDGVLKTLGAANPDAWSAVLKVTTYIEMCTGYKLSNDEQLYLLIHLVQIFRGDGEVGSSAHPPDP